MSTEYGARPEKRVSVGAKCFAHCHGRVNNFARCLRLPALLLENLENMRRRYKSHHPKEWRFPPERAAGQACGLDGGARRGARPGTAGRATQVLAGRCPRRSGCAPGTLAKNLRVKSMQILSISKNAAKQSKVSVHLQKSASIQPRSPPKLYTSQ